MPPRGSKEAAKHASLEEPRPDGDRISALPDGVLQHLLGFLPAQDAVRTSFLGTRWRQLWRSMPRLRITDVAALGSADKLQMFANQLLLRRDPWSRLDQCEIDLSGLELEDPNAMYLDLRVRHALQLRARVMRVCFNLRETVELWNRPLVSKCLKVLRIERLYVEEYVMDFSRCPVLEDLEITSSIFDACEFISPSVKRLTFVKCRFGVSPGQHDDRSRISAPSAVWLKIQECHGLAPVLGRMPSLQTASIWFGCCFEDHCEKPCSAGSCGGCLSCDEDIAKLMDGCVLLRGLSNATNLRFRASFGMFNFKMDLEWCPMFHKLITFYLVDWCLSGDLHALLRFLQHTPNLEKIILQLCQEEKCALETEDYGPTEQPIELRRLKFLEIKCVKIDESVRRTSKIIFTALGTTNLKLNIQTI